MHDEQDPVEALGEVSGPQYAPGYRSVEDHRFALPPRGRAPTRRTAPLSSAGSQVRDPWERPGALARRRARSDPGSSHPLRPLVRPTKLGSPSILCRCGFSRLQSTTAVRCPMPASAAPRPRHTLVQPAPGSALVTTTVLTPPLQREEVLHQVLIVGPHGRAGVEQQPCPRAPYRAKTNSVFLSDG